LFILTGSIVGLDIGLLIPILCINSSSRIASLSSSPEIKGINGVSLGGTNGGSIGGTNGGDIGGTYGGVIGGTIGVSIGGTNGGGT
jgi:hypothetical protein